MALNSKNSRQRFLPDINDGNSSKHKQYKRIGAEDKELLKNTQTDENHFPMRISKSKESRREPRARVKKSMAVVKFVRQSKDMLQTTESDDWNPRAHKRSEELRLPPLVKTPDNAKSSHWVTKLGLRDSFEIPRSLLKNLQDDILKIDRQLREEEKIREIRRRRADYQRWKASREWQFPSSGSTFEYTSRAGFSYFPCLTRSLDIYSGLDTGSEEVKEMKGRNKRGKQKQGK